MSEREESMSRGLILILLLLGCSGNAARAPNTDPFDAGTEKVDAGSPVTADDGERRWREALCEPFLRCGWFEDLEYCLQISAVDSQVQHIVELFQAAKAGEVTFDGEQVASCFAALGRRPCEDVLPTEPFNGIPECSDLFHGTRLHQESCASFWSCEKGQRCSGNCGGECVALKGRCVLDADCDPGLRCEKGRCAPPRQLPPPKYGDSVCQNAPLTTACGPNRKCLDRLCFDTRSEGAPCAVVDTCPPGQTCRPPREESDCGRYDTHLVCDPDQGRCVRGPEIGPCVGGRFCDPQTSWCDASNSPPECHRFKAVGDACRTSEECGLLRTNVYCDAAPGAMGVCVERPALVCGD
jgi:hypothetical protein